MTVSLQSKQLSISAFIEQAVFPNMTWGVFYLAKIFISPVEIQMVRADQTKIFRNKRAPFGGTSLFRSNPLQRKLPFHLHSISIFLSSCANVPPSRMLLIYQRHCKFGMTGKKSLFDMKNYRNFQPKILLNAKCPRSLPGVHFTVQSTTNPILPKLCNSPTQMKIGLAFRI